jgi:hypothetical protein
VLVDALPCNLMLTPGQAHDLTCAQTLLDAADPRALIGDKAYDADLLIEMLDRRAITPVIPPGIVPVDVELAGAALLALSR